MDDLLDMIVTDESPSEISNKIKEILFAKAAERVDEFRPEVANSLFGLDSDQNTEGAEEEEE